MAKRFGRNQRKKLLERIEKLEASYLHTYNAYARLSVSHLQLQKKRTEEVLASDAGIKALIRHMGHTVTRALDGTYVEVLKDFIPHEEGGPILRLPSPLPTVSTGDMPRGYSRFVEVVVPEHRYRVEMK